MSKTIERIERQERLFKRILRNRARRLLFRNRQIEMVDALGLFEEEEACGRRGGIYCLLGLRSDSCFLCSRLGVSETVKPTPMYDETIAKLGVNPDREPPPLPAAPTQVEEEQPAPPSRARKRRVRSKATVKATAKEESNASS